MRKNIGVKGFRKHFGGKQNRGTKREAVRLSAGRIQRYCLAQLQQAGLVGTTRFESSDGISIAMGKSLTKKGVMDMDRLVITHTKKSQK